MNCETRRSIKPTIQAANEYAEYEKCNKRALSQIGGVRASNETSAE